MHALIYVISFFELVKLQIQLWATITLAYPIQAQSSFAIPLFFSSFWLNFLSKNL
jgi:hypothetical protein